MWSKIGEIPLKTGETMQILVVKTPDRHYRRRIMSFLSYTNELWRWHLHLAIRGELDDLQARFYLGLLKRRIISNVSTWENGSTGIVAHLFTARNHRKKGACTALMKAQIQDFRSRGGKVLIGGFRPSSYPIAKSLGFKSIINNSEVMHYDLRPGLDREYFQAKKVFCRDSMWKDWPGISLLFGVREGWSLRSMKHKVYGAFDYEDYFLEDMRERSRGLCISKVLITEKENIVGYATLTSKHRGKSSFCLLDFFIHPAIASRADTLLDAIDFPPGKVRCYVESGCYEKRDMLLRRGFEEKTIQKQIKGDGKKLDIIAMELLHR
jgi:predicted GNAT family acetyltransferase